MTLENSPPLSLQQLVGKGYAPYWNSKHPYRVIKGSRGSKKSKTTALYYITKLMQHPAANLLVVRRTFNTLKDSCYSELNWAIDRLGVSPWFKCTSNPLEIVYLPTGQKILFRGFDDGLKITSIAVAKGVLCWVWIEEAYEITSEEDFNKLDMSIRGVVPAGLWKQITFTFNPWSAQSWLKKRFFDVHDDDVFTMTTTYQCNEWLDDADKKKFEKMRENNPRRYRIEGEGEWGIAEGLIYENVEYCEFDVQELRNKPGVRAAFGLDFGFTDPNALVCMIVDQANSTIYVFDDWYKTGATNKDIAEAIKDLGYGSEVIYCDAAEPKSILELQEEGLRAEAGRKGRDSVNHGIQLIQNYKIVVHIKCREFYHEICNYCWEKDKYDKPMDKPEHEFSHGMDAMRYGVSKVLLGNTFSFE